MSSYTFGNASEALAAMSGAVMRGDEVDSRVGKTKELSHVQIHLREPWRREILVPGRHASLPAQIAESMWVLRGYNDIGWLRFYLPRAPEFSDDGQTWRGGYGPRIRNWGGLADQLDQLDHVVELMRDDPLTRRAVIQIYDPAIDTEPGKDIPCNNWLHFQQRNGRLDMHVAIRSNDLIWGWSGINAFEWSFLQEVVAGMLWVDVGQLHFSISSLHIYDRHWDKAEKISWSDPMSFGNSVRFDATGMDDTRALDFMIDEWFEIEALIREEGAELAAVEIERHPEPLTRAWLWVLAYYWSGDEKYLLPVAGTSLYQAALESPKRKLTQTELDRRPSIDVSHTDRLYLEPVTLRDATGFIKYVSELHAEKSKAYGPSWKKRGEKMSIMANIARKVDRLGQAETSDETSADTAIDLLVYLIKYRWWLSEFTGAPNPVPTLSSHQSDKDELVDLALRQPAVLTGTWTNGMLEDSLINAFDELEKEVNNDSPRRYEMVDLMINRAWVYAHRLWLNQPADEYKGADHE